MHLRDVQRGAGVRPRRGADIQFTFHHGAEAGADLVVLRAGRAGGDGDAIQGLAGVAFGAGAGQQQRQPGRHGQYGSVRSHQHSPATVF
jgi:hypothetical protein